MLLIATVVPTVDSLKDNMAVSQSSGKNPQPLPLEDWSQFQKFVAGDGATGDYFGYSVAISGGTALIGSYRDDSNKGSAYVFTRIGTSWSFQQKLLADDGTVSDNFGYSVALDGDTALIGAIYADNGAAYVFTRSGTTWTQQAKLTASESSAGDNFGNSVSIAGETALIGVQYDDDDGSSSGSAYVFTRSGTTWTPQQKLTASDAVTSDHFGVSVSVSGDTALIGASGDDSNTGSAYVFTRTGTTWSQQQKLIASSPAASDFFGYAVALDVDTALIGMYGEDDSGSNSGAAYVFIRSGVSWTQQQKLLASDGAVNDYFGVSVSLSGDTALVGTRFDDDNGLDSGSAYMFNRSGTTWTQQEKLVAGDGATNDYFGYAVSLCGDTALIGAYCDDDNGADSGSAYVFAKPAQPVENIDTGETFSTIQAAINDPDTIHGHVIQVSSGVYNESVVINKTISLVGQDKDHTIINGVYTDTNGAVWIASDHVNFSGFTVQNSSDYYSNDRVRISADYASIDNCTIIANETWGIHIQDSSHTTINNSYLKGLFYYGGVYSEQSDNTTIRNCHISYEGEYSYHLDVYCYQCTNENIVNNIFIDSRLQMGDVQNSSIIHNTFLNNATFYLFYSQFINFSDNTFESFSTQYGADILDSSEHITMMNNSFNNTGAYIYASSDCNIINNVVNEKPLVYLEGISDYSIPYAGQVILNNCHNITVKNQDLSRTKIGVLLYATNESTVVNNFINDTACGVMTWDSHHNIFDKNSIDGNTFGFYLRQYSNHNLITNNSINASYTGVYFEGGNNNTVDNNDITGSIEKLPDWPITSYHIYYQSENGWTELETLHLSKFYEANMIDISDVVVNDVDGYIFRVEQRGGLAAHIDYISLYNGDFIEPDDACKIENKEDILSKIIHMDNDVVDVHDQVIEFSWNALDSGTPRFLVLKANEELYAHEIPITTPRILEFRNMMEYVLVNNGKISIEEMDYSVPPDFIDTWVPGSGHPAGEVHLWVRSDGNNLYGVLEVTSDNTYDETGWGSLYVSTHGGVREFRVKSNSDTYGTCQFVYTDSVSWQHMVYDFCIPLDEIRSDIGETIRLGFGCYGTMSYANSGVFSYYGNHSNINNNNISFSEFGVAFHGVYAENITNNNIFNHTMAGISLEFQCIDKTVASNHVFNNSEGIFIHYSESNAIHDNIISNNLGYGINLHTMNTEYDSYNNTIFNNSIHSNGNCGVMINNSENNSVFSNRIEQNSMFGVMILSSENNSIFNNYLENEYNAFDDETNIWNISKTLGTNIVGGPYLGGNYWDDYTGGDVDSDGLGDTPYDISGGSNQDMYPLLVVSAPPAIQNEYPMNTATMVERPPINVSVTVIGSNLDIHVRWLNHTPHIPYWDELVSWSSQSTGRFEFYPQDIPRTQWIWGNTTYTWSVNVTDGISWTNETFWFITGGSRYDVNNNDVVNFQDAGLVWVHRTSIAPYDGLYDINQDDQVNFMDAGLTWVNRD